MPEFYQTGLTNDWATVKGAARLLVAPASATFPTGIGDLIYTSGVNQYNSKPGWTELGATKGGVTVSTNNTEETLSVDQVFGDIYSSPTNWEATVQTALAQITFENLQVAWEGSAISAVSGGERTISYGQSDEYTQRRLAILYKNPRTDKIRATVFRIAQLMPVESSLVYNKEGDQQTIPVQFKGIADTSVSDPKARFFTVFEQV